MSNATGLMACVRTLAFLWYIWRRYGLAECLAAACRKVRFRQLNLGQPPGQMVFREQMKFWVAPEAVSAFRYFTDLDPDMCREMDAFLTLTRGSKRLLDVGPSTACSAWRLPRMAEKRPLPSNRPTRRLSY